MRRTAKWLSRAAGTVGLLCIGVVDTAGQQPKEPPKKAAVNPAPRAAANEAAVAQYEQHYGPQIRQVFRSEMHFMRIVCEPTKAQYEAIAADTEAVVKAAPRKFAEAMLPGGGSDPFDPRAVFTDVIGKSIRATLTADVAARYEKELELRAVARKRFVVTNLIATIDKALVLTTDQREKIGEVLAANWNEAWNQAQMLMYGVQYLPQMPDAKILPVLSDAQRTVWRGIPRAHLRFGIGFMQGIQVEDEVWDDKQGPRAAPAPRAVGKR